MGYRNASVVANVSLGNPAAAAETVIVTTGPLNLIVDTATVTLWWYINILIGTAGTLLVAKIRRGINTAGVVVNNDSGINVAAGSAVVHSGVCVDNFAGGADVQYSLNVIVGSATGASTVQNVTLFAAVL